MFIEELQKAEVQREGIQPPLRLRVPTIVRLDALSIGFILGRGIVRNQSRIYSYSAFSPLKRALKTLRNWLACWPEYQF